MPITALRPTLLGALTPALALLLGLGPHGAQALGLGRPVVHSTLGKPLDVSVPLLLAEGEQLTDGCLRAEVTAGDARVPAGLLQLRLEGEPGQRRVRLQSQARIDEPALRITLALGCPLLLTREFNAFVDPNGATPAPAPAPVYTPPPASTPVRVQADAETAPAPVAKPRPRPKPPKPAGPRLTLERPEILVAEAPRPVTPAASAPEMELTPELEAQIAQLEQTVAQLRAELLARQEAESASGAASEAASAAEPASVPASMPAASAPAPTVAQAASRTAPYRDPMTWVLTLAMSLIAGAAAFYFSRWRDLRTREELAYWRALHAAEGAGVPPAVPAPSPGFAPPVIGEAALLPDEGQHQITRPQPRPMPWPPAQGAQAPEFAASMQATQPLPPRAVAEPAPAPQAAPVLTVADELLDLQQQVEFLQLLGQHDAAADLLATRLHASPVGAMPYLILMELCQQRGEPEVFAELVKQFEKRFRTLAPQWEQSLGRGRSLDACPSVIAHLQVVWADAEAAMKMLQELLADGGGPGVPHFDLPAYRDLLTLYSVARDLFEAGMRSDEVDLMLPLDSSFGR